MLSNIVSKKPVYIPPPSEVVQDDFNTKEDWKRKDVIEYIEKKREEINIDDLT